MERIIANGRTYIRLESCSYGEFGGDGAVGVANIRSLMEIVKNWNEVNSKYLDSDPDDADIERPNSTLEPYLENADLLIVKYHFGDGAVAYLAEDYHSYDDIVGALADYPLLDEQEYANAEEELKAEFMDRNRSDIECQLKREFESHAEQAIYGLGISDKKAEERIEALTEAFEETLEAMPDEALIALLDTLAMNGQAEWTQEGGGIWFDVRGSREKLYEQLGIGGELIDAELEMSMN